MLDDGDAADDEVSSYVEGGGDGGAPPLSAEFASWVEPGSGQQPK